MGLNMNKNYWLNKYREQNVILRIENDIMSKTGLSRDDLKKMDLGDIEKRLGIVAKNPYNKRSLYRFISEETIKKREEIVTRALSEHI